MKVFLGVDGGVNQREARRSSVKVNGQGSAQEVSMLMEGESC